MAEEAEIEIEDDNLLTAADFEENPEDDIEPEPDEDTVDEPEAPAEPSRASRGNRQFGTLRKENRELRERLAKVEGAADVLSRLPQPQGTSQQDLVRQEREYLETLDSDQKVQYFRTKDRNDAQAAFAQQSFMIQDARDEAKFERLCDRNPVYARIAQKVETMLAEERKRGSNPTRQAIANFIIGGMVADRAEKKSMRTTQQASLRARRQTQPANPGSRVAAEPARTGKGKTAAERLKDVTF